jgi:hypothetical protein
MKLEGKTPEAESKGRSQRLFRDDPKVRFLISTEAGGEGINLQFCYILVNYDLPWNPMRYEQRVGRVYRYGQERIVHIYNLRNEDTIEDTVRSYFEQRLRYAADALSRVTGEDVEELVGSLNGQLETEIEPGEIYKRVLVEGNLNKQTKEEIKEAVQRAQKAYEIATTSLFRDCSSYSFDNYQRELASPVTLKDLEGFTLKFRKDDSFEFITPEALQKLGLPERYRGVTFDRNTAIRHSEAEFFAIGHAFVDTMLRHIGDYGSGGHTAIRVIQKPGLAEPAAGLQFNFTVRRRVERGDGTEYLFDLHTVVVRTDGTIDGGLSELAANSYSVDKHPGFSAQLEKLNTMDLGHSYDLAKHYLESQIDLWDWEEDVDLIGLAKVIAVPAQ